MAFYTSPFRKLTRQADSMRDAKNWQAAADLYGAAIAREGHSRKTFRYMIQRGNCLKEAGNYDEALKSYEQARKFYTQDSDLNLQIGHLYKLRGDIVLAKEFYRRSLKERENSDEVINEIEEIDKKLYLEQHVIEENPMEKKIWFDVSDILGYFPDNRTPTGIQRVQIGILKAIYEGSEKKKISLCRFIEEKTGWFEVDFDKFIYVLNLSLSGSLSSDHEWRSSVSQLFLSTVSSPIENFVEKSVLFNLGTSWWLPNYFTHIRHAKNNSNIYYVPLIHDVIPAATPQYCAHDLVHEFIDWLMGVVQHADRYMTVSQSTKNDFLAMSEKMHAGVNDNDIKVVRLASEFRLSSSTLPRPQSILVTPLEHETYVLLVSTVESRKNQIGALDAWADLYRRHGEKKIPKLVIVGKKGFESHYFLQKLNDLLIPKGLVIYIESVSDSDLEYLYRKCLFTIYPSFYEGWGLPITESLGYGKAVITADNSSLPEAGQGLAEIYSTNSQKDFVEKIEKLIFEKNYRIEIEKKIRDKFSERSWKKIADEMLDFATEILTSERSPKKVLPILDNGYYPLTRNRLLHIEDGITSSETIRSGSGWHRLEDFGCWTVSKGAQIRFGTTDKIQRISLELKGIPTKSSVVMIKSNISNVCQKYIVPSDENMWVFIDNSNGLSPEEFVIDIFSDSTESVVNNENNSIRNISVGVCSLFLSSVKNPNYKTDFIEDCLFDLLKYRKVNKLICV